MWCEDYPWDVRTQKICASLRRSGAEVHILARNLQRNPEREELPEGTVHRLSPWYWCGSQFDGLLSFPAFFNPRWIHAVLEVTRTVRPDVIIVRDIPICLTAVGVGRWFGVPVILDMAENYPAMIRDVWDAGRQRHLDVLVRNPTLVALVERVAVRVVDWILVVVEESKSRIHRLGAVNERIVVVLNTPPLSNVKTPLTPKGGDSGAPLSIVYLGFIEIPRGIGDLVEATAILKGRGRQVTLRVIGGGRDLELFRSQALELGLGSAEIEFYGQVDNIVALKMLTEADVGVVPHHATESWNTTIPNKLFDYWAAGIPVVTSDAIPAARIVMDCDGGTVFRSRDPKSLADALEEMFNLELRHAFASAGREAVTRFYNWECDFGRLLDVVRRAVSIHKERLDT